MGGFLFITLFIGMSDENNYTEKAKLNRVLGIAKVLYKTNPVDKPKRSYDDPYEFNIPKSLLSLPLDDNFMRALFVANEENFDNWGNMEDKDIIIPKLKKYKIRTEFSGSEVVRRTYKDEVEAYDEYDLTNALNNCDPCYDEGEEVDVEWMDREGDWTILDVQQISEDVNRVKEVMGLITEQENDCKNSDEAKEVKIKAEDDFIKDYKEKNSGKTIIFIDVVNAGNDAVKEFCKNRLNESKISEIDLEGYKKKAVEEGNNEWVEILDRFPDEFQREIIDERPEGSKSDINLIGNWELDPNYPVTMNLLNLLQTKSVKEAIGRTPRHVMEMIKTNPKYRLELEDVEHVSDTEVGREFGLKSDEIFDQNPERYEEYANYDPETAEPSTMVNGELYWGMGRLIAALLRGDLTIKVWAAHDFTTNRH